MSLYRRAAKRDDNEPECRKAAEELGASWEPVSGKGIPDALVGFRGETTLMEVKGRGKKLTPAQVAFRKRWRGGTPVTVTTADDVRAALLGQRVTLSRVLASEQAAAPAHVLVDEVGAYDDGMREWDCGPCKHQHNGECDLDLPAPGASGCSEFSPVGAYPTEGEPEPQRCKYGALVCTHAQCHGKKAA
jgi:hypothetical protein